MKLKLDLKKKPTLEDLNAWKKFTSGSEALYNKDINFKKKQNSYIIKKIDLHGLTLENANKKVKEVLLSYYKKNVSKVIVITGKGLGSNIEKNPYVSKDLSLLKYSIPDFLRTENSLKTIIKNISKAEIEDGGEGAFYVYLKKIKE